VRAMEMDAQHISHESSQTYHWIFILHMHGFP
jgi:hypothetical protein